MKGGTAESVLTVRQLPGRRERGLIRTSAGLIACALGRSGISKEKREGDGATPAGTMHALALLYRPDRIGRPVTPLPALPIAENHGWCDDPTDRNYNRAVTLPYAASHERLWREDHLYDMVVVLDWNAAPTIPGRGSAIFLHLWREDGSPTEGCIAVDRGAMLRLVRRLTAGTEILVG